MSWVDVSFAVKLEDGRYFVDEDDFFRWLCHSGSLLIDDLVITPKHQNPPALVTRRQYLVRRERPDPRDPT